MKTFFTSLFLLISCYSFAQTTYYVSLSGNNNNSGLSENDAWRTFTYAASSSSPVGPGDLVYIKAGNYGNENVVFQTNGTAANPIKFIGYQNVPGDNPDLNYSYGDPLNASVMPLFQGADRTLGRGIQMSSRQYLELSNVQITNYRLGFYAYGASNNKIKNIIAMEFGDQNASYHGTAIKFGSNAHNNLVEDCVVLNACAEGLMTYGNNNVIRNCRVFADDNSTGHYSAMDYYLHIVGNNNLVEDCYVERVGNLDHVGHGISLKGNCENNIVRNCTAKGMAYSGYQLRHRGVKNNLIENCIALDCTFLIRDGASNNIIRNCKSDGGIAGVGFMDTTEDDGAQYAGRNNVIENCIFQNNRTYGIDFGPYSLASIADQNTFINCVFDGGPALFRTARENDANKMVNCIVTNFQNYIGSGTYPLNFDYEYTFFHNNGFATPSGVNVVQADPQFLDQPNNDYHLTASSPCIDAGTSTGAPTIDYDGNQRPVNGIVDIGPYEFGGVVVPRIVSCNLSLLMEGPYNSSSNTMSTALLQSDLLPSIQPYSGAPWNYPGTEGAGWTSADYPVGSVDWVFVSLRTTVAAEDEIARFAAVLLDNGSIYTLNDIPMSQGISQVYVMIEHQNHLPIMSALPVDIINDVITYDFRTQDSYKGQNGTGFGQKLIGNNWMMYGGNADQDGSGRCDINAADRIFWQTVNGLFGVYNPGDYNLDTDINAADRIIFSYNNGIFTTIPKPADDAPSLTCPAPNFVLDNCTYTVNWTHPNPLSTVVNYDLKINGIDPGNSKLYPVTSWTLDICSLLGISSGSGSFEVELYYWYDGDTNNIIKTGTCTVNYNL